MYLSKYLNMNFGEFIDHRFELQRFLITCSGYLSKEELEIWNALVCKRWKTSKNVNVSTKEILRIFFLICEESDNSQRQITDVVREFTASKFAEKGSKVVNGEVQIENTLSALECYKYELIGYLFSRKDLLDESEENKLFSFMNRPWTDDLDQINRESIRGFFNEILLTANMGRTI